MKNETEDKMDWNKTKDLIKIFLLAILLVMQIAAILLCAGARACRVDAVDVVRLIQEQEK